jgi:diguanylate cyclase (GGDEF)-like protein
VSRLTGRELVVSRNGEPVAATVTPPDTPLEDGQTADLTLPQGEFRGHVQTLDPADDESLLLLGPRKVGGFLAAGRSAVLLLVGFLLLALLAAYMLARILTRAHSTVEEQALTDSLTGLQNRRRFTEQLSWETDRALRFGHSVSLLVLDVDDFKAINDLRGHPQGDAVLRSVADAIRASTRSIDFGARYGGDEFALMLIETEVGGATDLADRLCTRVRDSEVPVRGGGTMAVTASIGVATLPGSAGDADGLIDAADAALLQAKRSGKDQIRTASVPRFEPTGGT